MEIKQNDNVLNYEQELIDKFISELNENNGYAYLYKSQIGSEDLGIKVAKQFVAKGYYAKIVYFCESWKGYQGIAISKAPLTETCARMVYSRFIY